MLVLGLVTITHVLASTLATVWLVGALMVVGGIAQVAVAFRAGEWGDVVLCTSRASSTPSPAPWHSPTRCWPPRS